MPLEEHQIPPKPNTDVLLGQILRELTEINHFNNYINKPKTDNAKRLEYYQTVGNYVIAIAVFVSSIAFQALTTVATSDQKDGYAGQILGWSFFVINLVIVVGLISNFAIHYHPTHSVEEYEINIYRIMLYVALACLMAGFSLLNYVIFSWSYAKPAIAGWGSFGVLFAVWIVYIVHRVRNMDVGTATATLG